MDPMVGTLGCLKKAPRRGTYCREGVGMCRVPMFPLLLLLTRDGTGPALSLAACLACWLGFVMDFCPESLEQSEDHLDLPQPRGLKRSRRVLSKIKTAVTQIAAEGGLARSGRVVGAWIRRMRSGKGSFAPRFL